MCVSLVLHNALQSNHHCLKNLRRDSSSRGLAAVNDSIAFAWMKKVLPAICHLLVGRSQLTKNITDCHVQLPFPALQYAANVITYLLAMRL